MASNQTIPQYFAREPMETSRLPRAPAGIADTGQGLEAEAMGQFGQALFGVGIDLLTKLEQQRTDTQLAEGGALWDRAHQEFFANLVTDPDLENYEKKYNAFAKSLRRQILKKGLTQRAKKTLTNWITSQQPKMEKETAIALMRKQRFQGRATMLSAIKDYEISGNEDAAHKAINTAQKDGFLNAEEAERERQAVSGKIDWFDGLQLIDSSPEDFLKNLAADADPRLNVDFLPNLNPEQKLQLKARAKTVIRNIKSKKRIIEQEVWDKTEGEAFNLLFDRQLTPEWIRDQFNLGNLSPRDRDTYLRATVKPDDEVKLNWDTYDRLQGLVEDYDAGKIKKEKVRQAITDAVGKDITTTIARSLRDRLATKDDPDDPMNRSDVKRGLGFLEDLETAEINVANERDANYEDIRGIRLKYQKKKNEYERWIKKQEKLTGKDIENKTAQMTQQAVEEVALNWFERLMWTKRPQLFGLVGTQKERLAKKKIEELQELGKWEGLTPDEQETIRQAFLAGKSIQDVLDIMGQ